MSYEKEKYIMILIDITEDLNADKYCKECRLEQELTPASCVISLDDNIFDIKVKPRI